MATCCNSNNGCNRSCTRCGALNSLCNTARNYPYYTGPCPPAPCVNGCGTACNSSCCASCNSGCGNTCNHCSCNAGRTTVYGEALYADTCGGCPHHHEHSDSCGGYPHRHEHADPCGRPPHPHGCGERPHHPVHPCGCAETCCECDANECSASLTCDCGEHHRPGFGVYAACAPLSVSAGDAVPLSLQNACSHTFSTSYGSILIRRPGIYYAAVAADIPACAEVETALSFELNGQTIDCPALNIDTCGGCGAMNYAASGVFRAGAGSLLKLISMNDLNICKACAQPVFTITLIRLD